MKLLNNLVRFGIPMIGLILISSCGSKQLTVIPTAINTVSTVSYNDLRLQRSDYDLLKTASADATLNVKYRKNKIQIRSEDDDLRIILKKEGGAWIVDKHSGVARYGYLSNDYANSNISYTSPEFIVRHIAAYRLINIAQQNGADGIIEPIISTTVVNNGENDITFKTHAEGKMIRLKTNK